MIDLPISTVPPVPRIRVLVVDDDPVMLQSVRRILNADYDVASAGSASAALDILFAGYRFDAILADVWMPEGDGMYLYARAREVAPLQADRIVYMTGGGLPVRLACFIADRIVVRKPLALADVVAAIEAVAGRRSRPTGAGEGACERDERS